MTPSATSLSLNLAAPKDVKPTKHAIVICKTFLNGAFLLYTYILNIRIVVQSFPGNLCACVCVCVAVKARIYANHQVGGGSFTYGGLVRGS